MSRRHWHAFFATVFAICFATMLTEVSQPRFAFFAGMSFASMLLAMSNLYREWDR
jgi:hypothetical protein